jgi:hypothetical protein
VIQITPKTFLIPLLVAAIAYALISSFLNTTGETSKYNDTIGLNEITANYQSGTYEEIVVRNNTIEAKRASVENIINGKKIVTRNIDRTILPDNLKITDIGISTDISNPTKVRIDDTTVSRALWDIVPSIF